MTIRKTAFISSQRALVAGAVVATVTSLTGCGMLGSVIGNDKVDYRSAKKASTLDVPPDLTQLQKDNRYSLPDSNNGVATASGYNASKAAQSGALNQVVVPGQPAAGTVAQTALSDIKVERDGNQRWLVIKQTPEQLWPQLKSFWEDSGFTLSQELPTAGIMETEWNENRAKIPQDWIRNTIGKVFDSVYSSGERDKFRTRIERRADGSSEIYISHRGVQEVSVGAEKESTKWMARPNDPGLEAEFLARMMNKLGNGGEQLADAKGAVDSAIVQPQHASLVGAGADRVVQVDEGFDRAWRRVGLALDRAGFTVEDRDRTQGIYFVRYINDTAESKGFFSKLFSWGSSDEAEKEAQRYRISVKAAEGNTSVVKVLSNAGATETGPVGEKILTLLHEQLK
ncbi:MULTISPECIES: outer membrane protein assembly factor BamC [unclassified Duganella]|uniref:outer membrane protein assembly factor BamC n=1 Tax=unclassified Duganella TaxID=2636909 RepID=UPI000884E7D5|nr:outer membrane protein assembly factor BamC [Duganella sp. OV458]SDI99105.1 Beta-barrel assembly machine subunit BamC [Duganella sp. OV510]